MYANIYDIFCQPENIHCEELFKTYGINFDEKEIFCFEALRCFCLDHAKLAKRTAKPRQVKTDKENIINGLLKLEALRSMDYDRRKSKYPPTSDSGDVVKMEPFVTRQNPRKSFDGLRLVLWSTYKNLIFWRTVTSQQNTVCRRMCRKISPTVGLQFVYFCLAFH